MIAMAGSCKHIVQIMQLLGERGLSFSFCLNKEELLVLAGFGLLYQGLDLDDGSKLMKDNQKTLSAVIGLLDADKATAASEFRRVACSFLPLFPLQRPTNTHSLSRHNSDGAMAAPKFTATAPGLKHHLKSMAAKIVGPTSHAWKQDREQPRRATEPTIVAPYTHGVYAASQPALSTYNRVHVSRSEPARSPSHPIGAMAALATQQPHSRPSSSLQPPTSTQPRPNTTPNYNLDYLSFSNSPLPTPHHSHPSTATAGSLKAEPSDWERLLGSIDNGQTNIFDNIYGGPPVDLLSRPTLHHAHTTSTPHMRGGAPLHDDIGWSPDIWALTGADLGRAVGGNGAGLGTSGGGMGSLACIAPPTESVLSFDTDEGVGSSSSPELCGVGSVQLDGSQLDWGQLDSVDLSGMHAGVVGGGGEHEAFHGIVMPDVGEGDDGLLGWDNAFRL